MKKLFFAILLVTGLTQVAAAQEQVKESDVPAEVKTSFKSAYPDAQGVEWKMKEGTYKAKFQANGTENFAAFDPAGKLLAKGVKIKESEIPAAVSTAVKSGYADKTIDNVFKVEKNGTTHYMVKFTGTPETKVAYTADGQVVKEKGKQ